MGSCLPPIGRCIQCCLACLERVVSCAGPCLADPPRLPSLKLVSFQHDGDNGIDADGKDMKANQHTGKFQTIRAA